MKIDRVKLRNFRSHGHTVIAFERVNFIRGMNRSGKSGVAMAVEMALAGRCAVTDEGGKGFEQLIQEGQQTATVVLECGTVTITLTLDRSTGRTLKVQTAVGTENERTMLGKQAQEWIAEHIGTPDVINATLNAWRFMKLNANEQASLLARVLLPAKLELEPEVNAWLAGSKLSVVERPSLFGTIEATYKAIAAARTDVNRKLRDLKAIVEPDPPNGSREAVKEKLAYLESEQVALNEKLRVRSTAEAVAKQTAAQRISIEKEIEAINATLPDLRANVLTNEARKELDIKAKLRERQTELRTTLIAERANLAKIQDILSHEDDSVCPTCKTQLSAELREVRNTLFIPFRTNAAEAKATIDRLEKELKGAIDGEAAARQVVADNANRQTFRDAEVALNRWQDQLDAINASKSEPLDATESIAGLQSNLAELKARIAKGMDALVTIATLEEQQAAYQRQVKERKRGEIQLVELEKLLEYFGPRGIKAKLIAERLDLFTERVNGVLNQWGYSLHFTIEPYSLLITETDTETGAVGLALNPNQLSASEGYRLGVAFAMAIADWTGLRLLIADGADILDKNDKWTLAQVFLQSDLEQAIMTSTGIAGTFEAAGTAFYTLSKSSGMTALEVDAVTPSDAELVHG